MTDVFSKMVTEVLELDRMYSEGLITQEEGIVKLQDVLLRSLHLLKISQEDPVEEKHASVEPCDNVKCPVEDCTKCPYYPYMHIEGR